MISIIVAMSSNRVIGKDNQLPWHLTEDLKHFKKITTDNVVVMGRKTHQSIGKPLPNRLNVILSRDVKWYKPLGDNCVICYSIEEVLERFKYRNLFIIGGSEIYNQFLPHTDKIYLTHIEKEFNGDSYFPPLNDHWILTNKQSMDNSEMKFAFLEYSRI
jgi:dihydrofolate reductase